MIRCPNCNGTGKDGGKTCPDCGGKGLMEDTTYPDPFCPVTNDRGERCERAKGHDGEHDFEPFMVGGA